MYGGHWMPSPDYVYSFVDIETRLFVWCQVAPDMNRLYNTSWTWEGDGSGYTLTHQRTYFKDFDGKETIVATYVVYVMGPNYRMWQKCPPRPNEFKMYITGTGMQFSPREESTRQRLRATETKSTCQPTPSLFSFTVIMPP